MRVGPNHFTLEHIALQIEAPERTVSGEVHFTGLTPWPVTLVSPGIMGWYAWVPFMECYHGVVSLDHALEGKLTVNGKQVDFTGGRGYVEKDWGRSFPAAWVWLQTNHFDQPGTSITASIAVIPWLGSAFRGFIIGFWHAGRLYRFATYTGARVEKLAIDEHSVHWVVRDRQYRLEMVAARTQAGLLRGPQAMDMGGRVPETLQATVTVRLSALAGGVEHLVANFFPQADLDDLEIQAGLREFSVPVSLVDQVRIAGRSAYGRAAAVHVPLLIVQGAQDEVVKPAYTRRLARRFPHTPRYQGGQRRPRSHQACARRLAHRRTGRARICRFAPAAPLSQHWESGRG